MGIKGIIKILPDPKTVVPSEYINKTILVDTSIFLYKYIYGYKENFLNGFKSLIKNWKNSNLIFIFDGPPPVLKQKLLAKRKEIRNNKQDSDSTKIVVTKEIVQELKDFLDSSNIKWETAPGEAEKYAATFPDMYAVLTNDLDCFLFGCNKIIRNLKGSEYHEFDISVILEELNLEFQQFLELAIACGTDYYLEGLKGYGPKKALKFLLENKTFGDLKTPEFLEAESEFKK